MTHHAAYPCLVCGAILENAFDDVHNQPSGGTEFYTSGHYGSTFFDAFNGEELVINVCDACLRKHVARMGVRKVQRMVTLGSNGVLVGVTDAEVSYRAYQDEPDDGALVVTAEELGSAYSEAFPHKVRWHEAWPDLKILALKGEL